MGRIGRLTSIQVGQPRDLGTRGATDPLDGPWRSAFFKSPVSGAVWLGTTNLAGDAQADRRVHGGPDQAVLVYSADHYPTWREELRMDELSHGAFGENFTVSGQTEETVCIGDVYTVGEARVQVSKPRGPCWKIARRWRMKDLPARVAAHGWTGWYLRVLREGFVEAGMPVTLLERPDSALTVARA